MDKLNKTFKINPLYESDGYKIGHPLMLAPNTEFEYWTWIPRSLKHMHSSISKPMSAGQQLVWRYIHSSFQENFFDRNIEEADKFTKDMSMYLGIPYDFKGFKELHKLGYLPVRIKALPEGVFTQPNIPHMTGINTVKGYAWLGLFLETLVSKLSWQMPTAATIAAKFKENTLEWVNKTDKDNVFLADFMNHDFHSRGGNPFTSIAISLGHSLTNSGSDTLNAIPAARYYYDFPENEVPVYSVNASEHSVTCTGIFYYKDKLEKGLLNNEIERFYAFDIDKDNKNATHGSVENPDYLAIAEYLNLRDWLKKFSTGILSVVSDTFDLWKLITWILPRLKEEILTRDGKLVIRPDSGDPVDITCGTAKVVSKPDEDISEDFQLCDGVYYERKFERVGNHRHEPYIEQIESVAPQVKGAVELLWDIFGGTTNEQGYKVLNSRIGAIYGDAINLERQIAMYSRLEAKGFASTNIVLGVGSYTYVFLTRDSMGFAAKGAWFESNGVAHNIFKDPITDDGTKKSLKGKCAVFLDENGEYFVQTECTDDLENSGELQVIYENGKFYNQTTLIEIKQRLNEAIF